jgi:hypothetical protein
MNLEELETSWGTLQPPESPEAISGRRAMGMPRGQPVYLAVDAQERRHLLIQVPDNTVPLSQQRTRGLEVSASRYRVGSDPEALYVDLVCIDQAQNPTFCAVAEDLLRVMARPHGRARDVIISALSRWRTFWSSGTEGMSRERALKLFGELWFMRRWLAPVSAGVLGRWQAADDARYDYQWPAVSVEVKATESKAHEEAQHLVSSLDQMDDPEEGRLFLFSLQLHEDSLALADLDRKLALQGYSAGDRTSPAIRLRVVAERLYRVEDGFPRITRRTLQAGGLPAGVMKLGYTLDMGACQPWLVATAPTDPGASCLRSTG